MFKAIVKRRPSRRSFHSSKISWITLLSFVNERDKGFAERSGKSLKRVKVGSWRAQTSTKNLNRVPVVRLPEPGIEGMRH
jgi:hypothetical protein